MKKFFFNSTLLFSLLLVGCVDTAKDNTSKPEKSPRLTLEEQSKKH